MIEAPAPTRRMNHCSIVQSKGGVSDQHFATSDFSGGLYHVTGTYVHVYFCAPSARYVRVLVRSTVGEVGSKVQTCQGCAYTAPYSGAKHPVQRTPYVSRHQQAPTTGGVLDSCNVGSRAFLTEEGPTVASGNAQAVQRYIRTYSRASTVRKYLRSHEGRQSTSSSCVSVFLPEDKRSGTFRPHYLFRIRHWSSEVCLSCWAGSGVCDLKHDRWSLAHLS